MSKYCDIRPRINQFSRRSRRDYSFRSSRRDNPSVNYDLDCRRLNRLGVYVFPYSDARTRAGEEEVFSKVLLGALVSYVAARTFDGKLRRSA